MMRRILVGGAFLAAARLIAVTDRADHFRWISRELIPDAEGIDTRPNGPFAQLDLRYAELNIRDLTGTSLAKLNQ